MDHKNECITQFNQPATDIDRIFLYAKDPYKSNFSI